jgi:tricarballylate dehydrogenase
VSERYDVVVVGAGNAALCAAQAARERVERVLMLEKAPEEWIGGNSYFTAGAFRVTFGGLQDLRPLLDEVDEDMLGRTELPAYEVADFMADMRRVTEGRCDPELARVMVEDSADTVRWLADIA